MDIASFLAGLAVSYGQFFSFAAFGEIVSNPVNIGIIGSLVLLEGLLSVDNALVLAILVRHLPPKQQKKALVYGIFGTCFLDLLQLAWEPI